MSSSSGVQSSHDQGAGVVRVPLAQAHVSYCPCDQQPKVAAPLPLQHGRASTNQSPHKNMVAALRRRTHKPRLVVPLPARHASSECQPLLRSFLPTPPPPPSPLTIFDPVAFLLAPCRATWAEAHREAPLVYRRAAERAAPRVRDRWEVLGPVRSSPRSAALPTPRPATPQKRSCCLPSLTVH